MLLPHKAGTSSTLTQMCTLTVGQPWRPRPPIASTNTPGILARPPRYAARPSSARGATLRIAPSGSSLISVAGALR